VRSQRVGRRWGGGRQAGIISYIYLRTEGSSAIAARWFRRGKFRNRSFQLRGSLITRRRRLRTSRGRVHPGPRILDRRASLDPQPLGGGEGVAEAGLGPTTTDARLRGPRLGNPGRSSATRTRASSLTERRTELAASGRDASR
jgi:hypothetical protein